ncbi:MAG: hypothetical protein MK102_17285, partial [Fuerstiella sp.]|nr:hypothetical protein [Fuerstiella sp.]
QQMFCLCRLVSWYRYYGRRLILPAAEMNSVGVTDGLIGNIRQMTWQTVCRPNCLTITLPEWKTAGLLQAIHDPQPSHRSRET